MILTHVQLFKGGVGLPQDEDDENGLKIDIKWELNDEIAIQEISYSVTSSSTHFTDHLHLRNYWRTLNNDAS